MLDRIFGMLKEGVDELEGVELRGDTSLIASGYLDSYEVVTLLMKIEGEFGISVDLETLSLEDFETPDRIVQMIERKRA